MALFQPAPLQKGDRVALIAPSGPLPEGRLPLALDAIRARGLEPVAYPSVTQTHGYLASADAVRAQDVNDAFADDSIKGVLCARGGYGAQRLYPRIDWGKHPSPSQALFGIQRHHVFPSDADAALWHGFLSYAYAFDRVV